MAISLDCEELKYVFGSLSRTNWKEIFQKCRLSPKSAIGRRQEADYLLDYRYSKMNMFHLEAGNKRHTKDDK
ncbi:unnamed protein product [Acanthoscelides obtectus]|uniref:Uncharacterized protein n=1 Tax=Acanthoscelides obtectus TaxID=200917 RepID=A0A9P0LVU5_ACAOB|nr:unnamed protein product [Acanthoscelides obtectus]CAK1650140.1 hypothetical protein AOBTE_LOCUS16628 [Acanthoscelides obtectus]